MRYGRVSSVVGNAGHGHGLETHATGHGLEARATRAAFTLIEILLMIGILAALAAMALPNLIGQIERERMPQSAEQMRAMLQMTRANAMFDGRRYRIRFPQPDEVDNPRELRQPLIEREDDPLDQPNEYFPVSHPWAHGLTLHDPIWCAEVRIGKPFFSEDEVEYDAPYVAPNALQKEDPFRPAVYFEPNGVSTWATFVLTDAPEGADPEALEDFKRIEVIFDGDTGLAWLQRPFYPEEIQMFVEHDWPPVMRSDFLRPDPLTEDQVLEIREKLVRKK